MLTSQPARHVLQRRKEYVGQVTDLCQQERVLQEGMVVCTFSYQDKLLPNLRQSSNGNRAVYSGIE